MAGNSETDDRSPPIYDVLIIGAGPSGLAVASRLREQHPSALFTDDEHGRYHWINKHSNQASIRKTRDNRVKAADPSKNDCGGISTLVLDSSGNDWMTKWNSHFKTFNIQHLRSPMFFHPDPSDRDALLAYARETGREDECVEIAGCVGKEVSKHKKKKRKMGQFSQPVNAIDERDRKDYYTPSAGLFNDFCRACADRYHLRHNHIKHETVLDIAYNTTPNDPTTPEPDRPLFTIHTNTSTHLSRTVVLAIGAGAPIIPPPFPASHPAATHAMNLTPTTPIPPPHLTTSNPTTPQTILILGGGLTSAQLADRILTLTRTLTVHLLTRSHLKSKPFDTDLAWLGKYRNTAKAAFWSADSDAERLALAREARDGGSVPPVWKRKLRGWERSGRLRVHANTTVREARWDEGVGKWDVVAEPAVAGLRLTASSAAAAGSGAGESQAGGGEGGIDHIYHATGTNTALGEYEFLRTLLREQPIDSLEGLPILTEDLAWKEGVPLFVTGKLAMLRLGPGAGNLEGARVGAERVVWGLRDFLDGGGKGDGLGVGRRDSGVDGVGEEDKEQRLYEYTVGLGNRFAGLGVEGE